MTEVKVKVLIAQLCPTLQPRGLWPARLLRPWNSPDETAGVGCHLPLQGSPLPRDQTQVSCIAIK